MSAAQLWAQQRAAAIEKAARLRAVRSKDTFGGPANKSTDVQVGRGDGEQRGHDSGETSMQPGSEPVVLPRARPLADGPAATYTIEQVQAKAASPFASHSNPSKACCLVASHSVQAKAAAREERRKRRQAAAIESRARRKAAAVEAKASLQQHLRQRVAAQGLRGVADPARELPKLGYEPVGPIAAGAFSTILR